MKNKLLPLIACVLALSALPSYSQLAVGINFAGRQWSIGGSNPQNLAPGDSAGVISQQNWNNADPSGADSGGLAQITGPNAGTLTDNSGNLVTWDFSYTAGGMWAINQSTTQTGNTQLVNGYLDTAGLNTVTVQFDGIDLSLYTVYVYLTSDTNNRLGSISDGTNTKYFLTNNNPFVDFAEATATTADSATASNYAVFDNLSSSSFQLILTEGSGENIGIAGIQIVAVPEPQPLFLVAGFLAVLAIAGGLKNRRRNLAS